RLLGMAMHIARLVLFATPRAVDAGQQCVLGRRCGGRPFAFVRGVRSLVLLGACGERDEECGECESEHEAPFVTNEWNASSRRRREYCTDSTSDAANDNQPRLSWPLQRGYSGTAAARAAPPLRELRHDRTRHS